MSHLEFNKIDITDLIVVIALSVALLVSITYGTNELSMSIASGLLGYIGGSTKTGRYTSNTTTTNNPTSQAISNAQDTLEVAKQAAELLQSFKPNKNTKTNSDKKEE